MDWERPPAHLQFNLVDLLLSKAQQSPDHLAYTFLMNGEAESACLSYRQLVIQVQAVAAYLQSLSDPGDRILLLFPPGLDFLITFLGCLYAKVVAVPAYPPRQNQRLDRLRSITRDAQPNLVFTTPDLVEQVRSQFQELNLGDLRCLSSQSWPDEMATKWQPIEITPNTLAFLQYTSGSTGNPKGVMVSHGNIIYNEEMIKVAFNHDPSTIYVSWLPLFHDMGLLGNALQALYMGVHCVLMPPTAFLQKPIRWLKAISHYQATTSGGPNFAYDLCVKRISADQKATLDLSSWQVAFNGSEPVRAETLQRFAAAFAECGFRAETAHPCYGMAEATLIISGGFSKRSPLIRHVQASGLEHNKVVVLDQPQPDSRAVVSCGQTLLEQAIRIVDPDSLQQCPPDQVGEIWIAGPHVAQGYWHRQEATELTFQAYIADTGEGPFLRTGDLGFLLDGEVYVTGRIKDVIIIRGQNHYPQDIELTVEESHPALRPNAGAAFTIDDNGQTKLIIVQEVERTALRNLDQVAVIGSITEAVSVNHGLTVSNIVLIKPVSIPKTSSGKIQRHACRRSYLENSLSMI